MFVLTCAIIRAIYFMLQTIPEEAIEAEEAVSIEYGEKEMTVEIGESHSTTEVAEEVQFQKNEVELDPESIPVGWQHFWKMMKICGVHLPAKLAELDQPCEKLFLKRFVSTFGSLLNFRRGLGGKFRGGRGARGGRRDFDLSRFRSFEPLSDEHKATLQEAMNARYVPESKALDLKNFKADNKFGGSSKANGDLKNPKVMEFVLDTIGQHLSHLEALNLSNNGLRRLQPFSKIVDKAPGLRILYLEDNELLHSDELKCISQLPLVEIKLSGNPFVGKFSDGAHYARYVCFL